MPLSDQDIQDIRAAILATLPTSTVHELPNIGAYGPLAMQDEIIVWLSGFNRTCKATVQDFKELIEIGEDGTFQPVLLGDTYIHVVTDQEDGGTVVSLPRFAGLSFRLQRAGEPLLVTEFEILNSGGFQLKIPGDILQKGERFTLTFYELQGGTQSGNNKGSFFSGHVTISTNSTFDTQQHINKVIQLRGGPNKNTFTLPLVTDIEDNTVIVIECSIGNTAEQKVITQGGQYIYFNNSSKNAIYLRAGEVIWMLRTDDGFYVINDWGRVYKELARPVASYEIGLNEMECAGQLLNRSDYQRFWDKVQAFGFSIVDEATWNIPAAYYYNGGWTLSQPPANTSYRIIQYPYKGCFSTGDGANTFRVPDLRDMFLRGISSAASQGADRYYNHPGGRQDDMIRSHNHTFNTGGDTDLDNNASTGYPFGRQNLDNRGSTYPTSFFGGGETRPISSAVLYTMKY